MTLLIVASVLLVLAIGGHLIARDLPLVPRLLVATGLLLAAPTLMAQGLIGTGYLLEAWSPVGAGWGAGLMLLPALVVAGFMVPLARVRWLTLGKPPAIMLFIALALFAVVTAPLLGFGIATGTPQKAEHRIEVHLEPAGDGGYEVTVPWFILRASDTSGEADMLVRLTQGLEVVEGQAQATLEHGWLTVTGEGPAVLQVRQVFYGSVEHREAFNDWQLAGSNVTATNDTAGPVAIRLVVDLSGGDGHTCWRQGALAAEVGPGESKRLVALGREDADIDHEPELSTVCA